MTNDEVNKLLKQLTAHFGEPVMPVSKYCKALETWANIMCERDKFADDKSYYRYINQINDIRLSIYKSNLLWRLIYCGEELRTEKCPEHKGHWVGPSAIWNKFKMNERGDFIRDENGDVVLMDDYCGCDGTGWLPNKK